MLRVFQILVVSWFSNRSTKWPEEEENFQASKVFSVDGGQQKASQQPNQAKGSTWSQRISNESGWCLARSVDHFPFRRRWFASCVLRFFFCRLHLSSAWKCHSVQSQNWEIRTNGHLNPEKTLGFLFQPVPNLVMTLPVRHGKIHHAIDR